MPEETATAIAPSPSVGGEGAGAATSVVESPTTTEAPISGEPTTETAQPEAEGESPETGAESESSGEAGEDGRLLPKSIRALKDTDPVAYKAEKARFYEHREYKQTFPTVAEAKRVRQTLQLVGGEPGLQQMQTDISDFQNVARQFMDGDPKFVEDLAGEDPEAFGAHVPGFLSKYKEIDKQGYNREMAKHIHAEHQSSQLRPALENIYTLVGEGKTADALKALETMAAWHDRIEQVSKQEDDPRYKALKEKVQNGKKEEAEREKSDFVSSYRGEAAGQIKTTATKLYKSYFGREPEPEDLMVLISNADRMVRTDTKHMEALNGLLQRRDREGAIRHSIARYERALQDATKTLMRGFGRGSAAPVKPTNGDKPATAVRTATTPTGFAAVNVRPKPNEIDTSRTNFKMINVDKQAILRDGRKVSWKHLT